MKFTDYILERTVWFSTLCGTNQLAHEIARQLIKNSNAENGKTYEKLLWAVRRYE